MRQNKIINLNTRLLKTGELGNMNNIYVLTKTGNSFVVVRKQNSILYSQQIFNYFQLQPILTNTEEKTFPWQKEKDITLFSVSKEKLTNLEKTFGINEKLRNSVDIYVSKTREIDKI